MQVGNSCIEVVVGAVLVHSGCECQTMWQLGTGRLEGQERSVASVAAVLKHLG